MRWGALRPLQRVQRRHSAGEREGGWGWWGEGERATLGGCRGVGATVEGGSGSSRAVMPFRHAEGGWSWAYGAR